MRSVIPAILALLAIACAAPDEDGDGYAPIDAGGDDCDDGNPQVYPNATESCDGLDNNCDGTIDDADAATPADADIWYADSDADGYGNAAQFVFKCEIPAGYVADASDCNDTNVDANPGAVEICDGLDNNCDGNIDESLEGAEKWYADYDGDGYGDSQRYIVACDSPPGYVSDSTDCNDLSNDSFPGNTETCDDEDNDCDGTIDEDDAVDARTWFEDADGDGWGDDSRSIKACDPGDGWRARAGDCNDDDENVNPRATEICDSVDNDCDGVTDGADAAGAPTWYVDGDGDGYGTMASTKVQCSKPSGYARLSTDCDDATIKSYPGADEVCDDLDNDCDGTVDDNPIDGSTFYADVDRDGYGSTRFPIEACSAPAGYVSNSRDCNDVNPADNPDSDEFCDGRDNNCDGVTDEDASVDTSVWYRDLDSDGYGDMDATYDACNEPTGYTADPNDCDDADDAVNPGVDEICRDFRDNNCNNLPDGCEWSGFYEVEDIGDVVRGSFYYGYLGFSTAVGDFGSDGVDDLVGGGYYAYGPRGSTSSYGYGYATVVPGDALGGDVTDVDVNSMNAMGSQSPSYFGYDVDILDLDGDGVNDMAAGAYYVNYRGGVYVFSGTTTGETEASLAETRFEADSTLYAGMSLGHGDFNGDGYDDLMIGAYYDDSYRGSAYLFYGPVPSGTSSAPAVYHLSASGDQDARLLGVNTYDYVGYWRSLSGAGDVDGDGIEDILVGSYGGKVDTSGAASCSYCGNGFLLYGDAGGEVGDVRLNSSGYDGAWVGEGSSYYLGYSSNTAGDLDGDGYTDFMFGAYYAGSGLGKTYFFSGKGTRYAGMADAATDAVATFSPSGGTATYAYSGRSVSPAGDVNADGYSDVIIAAYGGGGSYQGWGILLYGPLEGDLEYDDAAAVFQGSGSSYYLGYDVAGGADFNDDGYSDFIMGAYRDNSVGYYGGAVWVIFGTGI